MYHRVSESSNEPDLFNVGCARRHTDLDAPNYNHGGGRVAYSGQQTIQPGAFKYDSPCPPNGQHRYRWTARARDKDGKTLARTNAMKKYP